MKITEHGGHVEIIQMVIIGIVPGRLNGQQALIKRINSKVHHQTNTTS